MTDQVAMHAVREKLAECAMHEKRMLTAAAQLSSRFPLTVDVFAHLDDIESSFVDQMVYRFSKLQDTLGEKIFSGILKLAKEDVKGKTFLDILHRMEELGLVKADSWLALRELRNEIAHEYAGDDEKTVLALNSVYTRLDELAGIYRRAAAFIADRFGV
mgnify:FL=1